MLRNKVLALRDYTFYVKLCQNQIISLCLLKKTGILCKYLNKIKLNSILGKRRRKLKLPQYFIIYCDKHPTELKGMSGLIKISDK